MYPLGRHNVTTVKPPVSRTEEDHQPHSERSGPQQTRKSGAKAKALVGTSSVSPKKHWWNGLTVIDGLLASLSDVSIGVSAKRKSGGEGLGPLKRKEFKDSYATTIPRNLLVFLSPVVRVLRSVGPNTYWLPRAEVIDVFEWALYFVRSVLEVVYDFWPKAVALDPRSQLTLLIAASSWPRESFVQCAKYWCTWPMAKYLCNDLPPKPSVYPHMHSFCCKGVLNRFFKSRLRSRFSTKNLALWNSILQGVKRGCAPVGEDFVKAALLDHRSKMSKPPVVDVDLAPSNGLPLPIYEFFWQEFGSKDLYPRLFEPSKRASYESTRSDGGAYEYIQDIFRDSLSPVFVRFWDAGGGMPIEIRGFNTPSLDSAIRRACYDVPAAKVAEVLEPLKVRLITKQSALQQWVSMFYQKAMWRHLASREQFKLISEPLSVEHLLWLESTAKSFESTHGLTFDRWASGDFKAATDGLSLNATKSCFNASLARAVDWWEDNWTTNQDIIARLELCLRDTIFGQTIHYPERYKIPSVLQTNGQLMGSILSFPILCAVNFCTYWYSMMEYTGNFVDPWTLPVLVNGDDILFRTNQDHYQLWIKALGKVDFALSQGKNYVHNTVLMINSELYYNPASSKFIKLEFNNVGLLTGQSKVTGRTGVRTKPLYAIWNELLPGLRNPLRGLKRFIHYSREMVERITLTGKYNLFVPPYRGGLGFNRFPGLSVRATEYQRRWAAYLERLLLEGSEKRELQETLRGLRIALHSPTMGFKPVPRRNYTLILGPATGPLPFGLQLLNERLPVFPALTFPWSPERSEMVVRPPSKAVLDNFRRDERDSKIPVGHLPNKAMADYPFAIYVRTKEYVERSTKPVINCPIWLYWE